MTTDAPPWISRAEIREAISMDDAVHCLQRAFLNGLDPSRDFDRVINTVERGQLLYMPSRSDEFVGAKVSTVAPENPAIGADLIQGVYVLFDAITLAPLALMDGQELTALRTPAVSASIADYLAPTTIDHLVIFGSGTQAWGHLEAFRAIRDLRRVTFVARSPDHGAAIAERATATGLSARLGSEDSVRDAQAIVCATRSSTPLFDGALVPADSLTVAIGSHQPTVRELDSQLISRAQLVVEDPAVALREAGDIIIAMSEQRLDSGSLVPMRDIITHAHAVDHDRPRVFKSSGMPWQDLVVAAEVYRAFRRQRDASNQG